jgi:hypothetical protein
MLKEPTKTVINEPPPLTDPKKKKKKKKDPVEVTPATPEKKVSQ